MILVSSSSASAGGCHVKIQPKVQLIFVLVWTGMVRSRSEIEVRFICLRLQMKIIQIFEDLGSGEVEKLSKGYGTRS